MNPANYSTLNNLSVFKPVVFLQVNTASLQN